MTDTTQVRTPGKGGWAAMLFAFLISWEGISYVAHHDSIDPPGTLVYCVGATYPYEKRPVHPGQRFTKSDCFKFYWQDIQKYIAPLQACMPAFDTFPDSRKVALASAAYNLGPSRICKNMAPELNAGNVAAGCYKLIDPKLKWNTASGRYLRGLDRRRHAEYGLCMESINAQP